MNVFYRKEAVVAGYVLRVIDVHKNRSKASIQKNYSLLIIHYYLINRFPLPAFKILKYKCAQFIQRSEKGFAVVGFRELLHEAL
jgi:hypothetical protein